MKIVKIVVTTVFAVCCIANTVFSQGFINVDDPSLMKEAIDFANIRADIDTLFLTQPGGIYTTHDTLFYEIKRPVWILAKPGLAEMPIITHSDDSSDVLEMFRIYDDVTFEALYLMAAATLPTE